MIVTMADCRAAGFCRYGWRTWFTKYGLDYQDFRKNGIEEEKMLATGDALAIRLVEEAHRGRR